ncbi:MAG: DUF4159 domain-containing protein [Calditrichia bacterium]
MMGKRTTISRLGLVHNALENQSVIMKSLFKLTVIPILFLLMGLIFTVFAQDPVTVARIKYDGGGDWYGNRTTFPNLFRFLKEKTNVPCGEREVTVEIMDNHFFKYPLAYIAGHGNVKFGEEEVNRLRKYLINGGFLWADDDYGMDASFRREMKKVFPDLEWVELPFSHPIYHVHFQFPNGLPKIHKHAGGPPKGLALLYQGRMVVFYSFNTDISDGCEDPEIHQDPPEIRDRALKMAANIIIYALTH